MDLTVIGFVIAVVGIILQLSDAFPEHRETRKVIVFLTLGVFVGIVASSLLGAKYEITGNVDRQFALLFALAGAAAIFGVIALFFKDGDRRGVAVTIAGAFGLAFIVTGLAVGIGSSPGAKRYSSDEILILANAAEQRGQYELAIDRLKEFRDGLSDAQAQKIVENRIADLQKRQVNPVLR